MKFGKVLPFAVIGKVEPSTIVKALILNLKIRCDLGNFGDVRTGARTGMMRTLRFTLIKTGKNEKQKKKKRLRGMGLQHSKGVPFSSRGHPLQVQRGAQDEVLRNCVRKQPLSWERENGSRESLKGFSSAM